MKWLNDHFIIHRKDKWMAIIDVSISYKRPQKEKKKGILMDTKNLIGE